MEPSTAPSPPSVLVSTGTDKRFPFDRLIDWVERWAARHPEVDVFVQHGVSRAPALPSAPQLSGDDLDDRIRGADAVVLQAGPGGIMRSLGIALCAGGRPSAAVKRRACSTAAVPRSGSAAMMSSAAIAAATTPGGRPVE